MYGYTPSPARSTASSLQHAAAPTCISSGLQPLRPVGSLETLARSSLDTGCSSQPAVPGDPAVPSGDAQGLPASQDGIPGKRDSQQANLHPQTGFPVQSRVQGYRSPL